MYRAIITPTEKEHTLDLPEQFFGKKVEVRIIEIQKSSAATTSLKNKAFWDDIEFNPNFPSIEEIRETAWPKKEL